MTTPAGPWSKYQRPQDPDPRLFEAVRYAESGADPSAVSPVGAIGTMQTMPETLRDPGYGVEPLPEEKWEDPMALQQKGEEYLSAMYRKYGGDTEAALIAYNAGPRNADRWLASGRDYASLPKRQETEPYVQKVMARMEAPQDEGPWSKYQTQQPEQQEINPDTGRPWTPEEIDATKISPSMPQNLTQSGDQGPWKKYMPAEPQDEGSWLGQFAETGAAGGIEGTLGMSEMIYRTPESASRYTRGAYRALQERGVPDWLNPFGAPTLILDKIAKGHDFGKFHAAGTSDVADEIGRSMQILNDTVPMFKEKAAGIEEGQKAWDREEWRVSKQVSLFNFLSEEKGKDFAFNWFRDGRGYFSASQVRVPFVTPKKAFILYLCWEQANLRGNNVTLEKLNDDEAFVRTATLAVAPRRSWAG